MLRIHLRTLLGLCLLLLVVAPGFAQPPLHLSLQEGRYPLAPVAEFAPDPSGQIDLVAVQQTALAFQPNTKDVLAFGYVDGVYWIRVRVQSQESVASNWLLEISGLGRAIDAISTYMPDGHGQYQTYRAGDAIPFAERRIAHHAILFPLTLQPGQAADLYLRVQTNGTLQIPMTLWSAERYLEHEHHTVLLDGIFYGVLLIMIFYNCFIFLSVRDSSYILYVLYLACVLLFAFSIKGVGFEYLWPQHPVWNNKSNLVFAELGVLCLLLFARSFLQTPRNTPWVNYLIATLILTSIASFPFVVVASHRIAATLLAMQYLITVGTVMVAASLCLKRGFKAARYYLLGWLSVLLSILVWVLNSFNWIHSLWVGDYLFQAGTVLQVLLFSFALADRINLMRFEREAALTLQLAHSKRLESMAQMFEKFVPKQFLQRIAREGIENIRLGKAEAEDISVLFADIRGFTALSETLTPQELLNFLNACFTRLDKVIHEHNGFVDKFLGDGIMALFDRDTPDSAAQNAVMAAVGLHQAIRVYNQHRANSGYAPIDLGIGIHTGPVIIGTVGSRDRMDSTVLGDNVNIAARLQELSKLFGARIIISEQTRRALQGKADFHVRDLGSVQVRGRRNRVQVFELLDADPPELFAQKLQNLPRYRAALESHQRGDWLAASKGWRDCLAQIPSDPVCTHWLAEAEQQLGPDSPQASAKTA